MHTFPHSSHFRLNCRARVDIDYFLSLAIFIIFLFIFFMSEKVILHFDRRQTPVRCYMELYFPPWQVGAKRLWAFVLAAEGWVRFLVKPKAKGNNSWAKPSQHLEVTVIYYNILVFVFCRIAFFIFMFHLFGGCCCYISLLQENEYLLQLYDCIEVVKL